MTERIDPAAAAPVSPLGPLCSELRSKKWHFLERPPRSSEELLDGSGHCWCAETMMSIGPDSELVDPDDCRSSRTCFRSMDNPS